MLIKITSIIIFAMSILFILARFCSGDQIYFQNVVGDQYKENIAYDIQVCLDNMDPAKYFTYNDAIKDFIELIKKCKKSMTYQMLFKNIKYDVKNKNIHADIYTNKGNFKVFYKFNMNED